jgi:glycosyltransferase involved in cell wall biosynthesis
MIRPVGVTGLRIAHLIESDGPGGAEQVVADLAVDLQESGAQSIVFLPARGEGWLAGRLTGTGVLVEYFDLNTPISPACARSLAMAFRHHRIEVAHSHEFSMAVYGAWASWLAGVHHVITMHGSRYYAGRLQRRLALRAAIASSDRIVAVSHRLAEDMSRDLLVRRARIEMIRNGVRRARAYHTRLREELGLGSDARLLVAVGNLYAVKGHRYLVEAVALLSDRHPNLHVAIAGRGKLETDITTRAGELGVSARIHLLGLRSDIPAVLAAADVFVLPSLSEGLPLALLEAMFAGRPIVASDVGEIGTALDRGRAGRLVAPGNPVDLAAALDDLLSDPNGARRLGARARSRAAAEYDVSQMVCRYRSMYEQLLTDAPVPVVSLTTRSARPHS